MELYTVRLIALGVLISVAPFGWADEQRTIDPNRRAAQHEGGAVSDTAAEDTLAASPSADEIGRAYMNCLIEVDNTLAELALKAKQKALKSEAESQRAFCANRKRDCLVRSTSPECRTFIEEFSQSKLKLNGKK